VKALLNLLGKLEIEGYQVSMHLLAPGTTFGAHCPCESRIDAVCYGQLRVVIGGRITQLGPGDWIEIPAGVTVTAEVVGDEPVLAFDVARDAA
jgi:mannose-6-phosphate isomerase-like protein (cupin superfamily)